MASSDEFQQRQFFDKKETIKTGFTMGPIMFRGMSFYDKNGEYVSTSLLKEPIDISEHSGFEYLRKNMSHLNDACGYIMGDKTIK